MSRSVEERIKALFDTATGGANQEGWAVGETPQEDDIALALIDTRHLEGLGDVTLREVLADGSERRVDARGEARRAGDARQRRAAPRVPDRRGDRMKQLAPDLFNRRFQDLVEIGRAKLPSLAPDWTDHNAHDPGITLMELLAWVAEAQLYSLARRPGGTSAWRTRHCSVSSPEGRSLRAA